MSETTSLPPRVLLSASRTDPGRVRDNNEDLPLLDPDRGVYGVIDGVGGQAAGELAAAIARDVIQQRLARPLGTPAERVREAIALANNEIYRRAQSSPELAGMTCVVTLAIVYDGRVTIGHVGDTRLYKIRPSGIRKLTHDHSPVGEREDAREISEVDAMRHPRRHEVFRDVGGALRDKDEDEYVEIIEDVLERDAALLVCSDGLTDMITSPAVERIVRRHAGDPDAVTTALVAAANDAGGRDNVTVVYAETPAFAAAMTGLPVDDGSGTATLEPGDDTGAGRESHVARRARGVVRGIVSSRTTWFVLGVVLGVAGALLLAWRALVVPPPAGRTIVAAPIGSVTYASVAAAIASARSGDTIRLEPGTYAERLAVPDGVSLSARVPGAAVFIRPAPSSEEWVAITATGDAGGSITGIRIESTPERPVEVGVRVQGQGRSLELLQLEGPMRAGVDLAADASATLHGSHLSTSGAALVLAERSQLEAVGNVFLRQTRPSTPPVTVADGAQVLLRRNVFAGYGPELLTGLPEADRELVRAANVVVSSDAPAVR